MARVAVAMSGGVDSSVAAWLLKQAGHEVLGLSQRLGQGQDQGWRAGARAAAQLNLAHQAVGASQAFADSVVIPSAEAYAAGQTPNPCALCNARVKLPLLWQAAQAAGCQALATGHYARLRPGPGGPFLAEAADGAKSQAYFLARVGQDLLGRLLLPLAELSKAEVRDLAARAGLEAASRPESQDVCFLPSGGWDELVARYAQIRGGPLEDQEGRELARHGGLHRFTIGQRRGLGVALGRPLYVLALDGNRAAVTVGPEPLLWARGLWGGEPLWYQQPGQDAELRVRVRYAHQGAACWIESEAKAVRVHFHEPQRAVAPGQLAVFLQGDSVLGSVWIREALH